MSDVFPIISASFEFQILKRLNVLLALNLKRQLYMKRRYYTHASRKRYNRKSTYRMIIMF